MSEYVVYMLYSEKHSKIYVGYSTNLINRIQSHNVFARKGFTVRYRPWKVIGVEFFDDRKTALDREAALKGAKGREWIRKVLVPEMVRAGFISA